MTINRRSNNRVGINLRARWDGISGQQEARIGDISLGGCYVDSLSRVDVGEFVALEVELPSGEWLPLRGEVTTCQEGVGFGLQFVGMTQEEETALKQILG
ncbi:MAG TPA: PilZ domain-containing protein [Pyrinomonadaceae bacterium]|nr:PilZ domain-containing protein [Pyrinomonadaceae bacterium]